MGNSYIQPIAQASTPPYEAFIRSLYATLLQRPPDMIGLRLFVAKLENGMAPTEIIRDIVLSEEYEALNKPDQDYVRDLYCIFLRREITLDDTINGWVKVVHSLGRSKTLEHFAQTPEASAALSTAVRRGD